MISENARVNAAAVGEQFDVGENGIEKVITQSACLVLVETEAGDKIELRVREDLDLQDVWRRISSFAFSQSTNFASPEATWDSRTRSSSSCQAGDSIASGFADKFSQIASMVWTFSSGVISFSGITGMAISGAYHGKGEDRECNRRRALRRGSEASRSRAFPSTTHHGGQALGTRSGGVTVPALDPNAL